MKRKVLSFLGHFLLISVTIIMVFPLFWMLLLSLREFPEQYSTLIDLLLAPFTLKNYQEALSSDSFFIYFVNSLIVTSFVTLGNLILCFFVAYALERKRYVLNKYIFYSIIAILIIPQHIIMIPLYRLIVNFGWINTYFALIIPWIVTPFGIFMVKQYIQQIPYEIEESAKVDGCSDFVIIFKILIPLSKPIFTVLGIYIFLTNWNSFLFPFILTNEDKMRTLPVGLAFYLGKQSIDWGHLMAGSAFSAFPVMLLFLFFRKKIIEGLIQGALKD